ncbi:PMU2 [Candida pseudojiufengensis]|uniref:PMU2 n=1 Tax=Candida pseudojiufengensis TaxID=497109 RepID=UPI00222458B1|nr:PMU2 [Candida pseudojiufengensis]KAI5963446.1 PMU2 [Candida pseudojiufengensis]
MSLLIPNSNDYHDAHGDLDQDELYRQNIRSNYLFQPVSGLFKQTDLETDDMSFRYTDDNFGIKISYKDIIKNLKELNDNAPENVQYKLLFLARHGQSFANVVARKYTKEEWFAKWRYIGFDGEFTYGPDADLTDLGIRQALENNRAWKRQLELGCPFPKSFYLSPLQRSIKTFNITWGEDSLKRIENKEDTINISPNLNPQVIEPLRETIGIHLCHKRSKKSELCSKFPYLQFSEEFPEEDLLFEEYNDVREKLYQQFMRIHTVLENIFENDKNDVISITSHAGTIRAFLTVINHRKFTIPTGGMIPVIVRAEKVDKS